MVNCFSFLRLPSIENQRIKWVQAIEKYQKIDRQKFNVCIRHFQDKDLKQKGKNKMLISDAIPSIFPRKQDLKKVNNQAKAADIGTGTINESNQFESILRSKVADLKKEILINNINNDIKIQKLEQRILSLESDKKNMSGKLKEKRVQLLQKESKNAKLEKKICALKKEQYISSDDAKFSNVIYEYVYVQNFNENNYINT